MLFRSKRILPAKGEKEPLTAQYIKSRGHWKSILRDDFSRFTIQQYLMIIAEIGQAHDGSLGILHSYIDALAPTGVDAIKFQTHIAEAESSPYEQFRIPFSYVDKTRFDYWKRMELSLEQWMEVKAHCDAAGVQFISSPFSCAAIDLLEKVGIQQYKVGSGEVTNHLLLQKIQLNFKELIF